MEKIIYYTITRNGFILFSYNGNSERYLYYTFNKALREFKKKYNLRYKHNIKLVKNNFCGIYGYMYN